MHVSRPDDHFNLEVMETYFCMSSCLEGKVSAVMIAKSCEVISCSIQSQHDMFLFFECDLKSPKLPKSHSYRAYNTQGGLSYTYPDDSRWAVATGNS